MHQYLRSIHVNPKGVVNQRGLRNYAGPNCPGKGWSCTNTKRTVVQISKRRGKNMFRCTTARCAVVQISKSFADNTASCIKTTGVTQSCAIAQPNASGLNKAVVWMDTGKLPGLAQTVLYTASITQGPASAAGFERRKPCLRPPVDLRRRLDQQHEGGERDGHDRGSSVGRGQPELAHRQQHRRERAEGGEQLRL